MRATDWVELVGIILVFIATTYGHKKTADKNNAVMMSAIQTQSDKADAAIDKAVAVYAAKTDERLDELTREVREHNNFARRVPVLEKQIENLERRVNAAEK